jgi:hypothetical protein
MCSIASFEYIYVFMLANEKLFKICQESSNVDNVHLVPALILVENGQFVIFMFFIQGILNTLALLMATVKSQRDAGRPVRLVDSRSVYAWACSKKVSLICPGSKI